MRRTKLVLAALALMVAMLVALSAPAMADDRNNNNGDHHGKNHHGKNHHDFDFDRKHFDKDFDCCDFDFDFDDRHFFVNEFDDDCEWEFKEGWFIGPWGLQWGWWFLDC